MSGRWVTAALTTFMALLLGCTAVDEPRWAERASGSDASQEQAVAAARTFDSPRTVFVVESDPDIGGAVFRGTVRSREPVAQLATGDGQVLEVFFARNDPVAQGDAVLSFVPSPTAAQLIELDIAQLQIELAEASGGSDEDIAAAQQRLDDLERSFTDRREIMVAPASGRMGSARQVFGYRVRQGEVLFEINDPTDTVIEVVLAAGDLDGLQVGTSVTVAGTAASAETFPATIVELPELGEDAPEDEATSIVVEAQDAGSLALGDQLSVSIPINVVPGSHWVPRTALHRADGVSYLLAADENDQLRRVDIRLGRGSVSHVRVLGGVELGMRLVAPR